MNIFIVFLLVATFSVETIYGHGILLEPPNRSALWKFYPVDNHRVVPNYDLTGIFCGGYSVRSKYFELIRFIIISYSSWVILSTRQSFVSNSIIYFNQTQWDRHKGKCGVCGDPYGLPHPQPNENTGKHGKFGPVRTYASGSVVNVKVQLTANHRGKFRYRFVTLII